MKCDIVKLKVVSSFFSFSFLYLYLKLTFLQAQTKGIVTYW